MVSKPASPESETPAIATSLTRRGRWAGVWRVLCWGGAAAAAVTAVALVGQTPTGAERLQLALAQTQPDEPQAVAALPPRVVVDEAATRRLAEAVRALSADRDRLNTRIASLERNFDDMTGSIKTVLRANAAVQSAKEPAKEPVKEKLVAIEPAKPAVSVPQVTEPAPAPPTPPAIAGVTPPAPARTTDQQPQETVPLPPVRVASAPSAEPAAEAPAKPEYGIDLGAAASVEAIRSEWAKVKANYGPLLGGLHPIASPRQHPSGNTDYRLVIGPFPTTAAAARLCAKFNAARIACRTAKFTGEDVAQR